MAEATVKPEIGICRSHEDQHFKADDCDNWRSECERKGHVYWNHGQASEGSRCLDCGTPKVVVTSCVNVHADNSVCNLICELGTPCCVCSDRGEQNWCERCLKRNYTW